MLLFLVNSAHLIKNAQPLYWQKTYNCKIWLFTSMHVSTSAPFLSCDKCTLYAVSTLKNWFAMEETQRLIQTYIHFGFLNILTKFFLCNSTLFFRKQHLRVFFFCQINCNLNSMAAYLFLNKIYQITCKRKKNPPILTQFSFNIWNLFVYRPFIMQSFS